VGLLHELHAYPSKGLHKGCLEYGRSLSTEGRLARRSLRAGRFERGLLRHSERDCQYRYVDSVRPAAATSGCDTSVFPGRS